MRVIGVIFQNWHGLDGSLNDLREVTGVPADIASMCDAIEEAPRICGSHQRSADDEMTIKMAQRRNCRMLDNDNYRDWARHHPDGEIRAWLKHSRRCVQMNYYFDSSIGCFETLDGMRPQSAGHVSQVRSSSLDSTVIDERGQGNAGAAAVTATLGKGAPAVSDQHGKGTGSRGRHASRRRRGKSNSSRARQGSRSCDARGHSCCKVHVGNVPLGLQWQELKEHMSQAGPVDYVSMATAHSRSRGWACVLFAATESAEAATATLHGSELRGRALTVSKWVERSISMPRVADEM